MLPRGKLRHAGSLLLLSCTVGKSLSCPTKHCAPASKKYGLIGSVEGGFFSTVSMQKHCGHAEYFTWLCSSSVDFNWNV